jgi:hypothetical protein
LEAEEYAASQRSQRGLRQAARHDPSRRQRPRSRA